MSRLSSYLLAFALCGLVQGATAGECDDHFRSSGSVLSGSDFSSRISVADLSVADALGQMRGIMIAEKMDVIAEDVDSGSLLVEQRASGATRAIPSLIDVKASGADAVVQLTVKTEKGQLAKADTMRGYLCSLLAKVSGGEAGRLAAARGSRMQNNDDTTLKDVYVFSREIAQEAKGNALTVTARHKGRNYSLRGRVAQIMEDGDDINVSFDVPEQSKMLLRVPGDREAEVGVACLFNANQLANVLTFRQGDKVVFNGSFLRYDSIKRNLWLQNCKQVQG